MYKTPPARITDRQAFVFIESQNGGFVPFINFEALRVALLAVRFDVSILDSMLVDAKLELLGYETGARR